MDGVDQDYLPVHNCNWNYRCWQRSFELNSYKQALLQTDHRERMLKPIEQSSLIESNQIV